MKCEKCGYEAMNDFDFCPQCGTQVTPIEPVFNVAHERVLPAVKDALFLIMTILLSVATVLELSKGDGIPVLSVLAVIFLWLTYAKGTKNIADPKHLRGLSGTVYAGYVINNVAFIIFIVCGVILSVLLLAVSTSAEYITALTNELAGEIPQLDSAVVAIIAQFSWAIGLLFMLVGGAGLAINLCGMRKIHLFVKSVYQGILTGTPIFAFARAAKNWLIFFAVCYGLDIISDDPIVIGTAGCYLAAIILAVVLINKYFLNPTQIEE